ncbi:MAG: aminomethyl-transferring glycine dehydrogenase [Polyangiaceae bacterium]|nr:aminomethyl-transferring glycine dehydrogenase [Polyangiaceae bacterium]
MPLEPHQVFARRHIGPSPEEQARMLEALGYSTLQELIAAAVPATIRMTRALDLPPAISEADLLVRAKALGQKNKSFRSYIGMGYASAITPPVILRNIIENPAWYTQYTPYQAEISQGRLEALLNFQTMVSDLTGLPVANASLLDEGTAAAEAMHLAYEFKGTETKKTFFVSSSCHPQTIEVVRTRAKAAGLHVEVGDPKVADLAAMGVFGALVQYPSTDGEIASPLEFGRQVHAAGALFVVAADILALALITPPGEFGADVAVGSTQRFGVPLGYGGPHAAYFATKYDFVRKLPGRIIGVSEDASQRPALRMALQTREQHIRRERATSNICTAQALLAIVASMYAVYHGPEGIRAIAESVHEKTCVLYSALRALAGVTVAHDAFFDTLRVDGEGPQVSRWMNLAEARQINLRRLSETSLCITIDETTSQGDLADLAAIFGGVLQGEPVRLAIPDDLVRTSAYLTHPVFHAYHSETEMLRYMRRLEERDLSLVHSMIPLGSCTMKLNATAEMMPITDPAWNGLHPFVPLSQAKGYAELFGELEKALAEITGFAAVSLQPNAGSQGEYAGLLAIKGYQETRGAPGQKRRKVCLIPSSAHGTNPASAVMAGMEVVVVNTDDKGNIDMADLEAKAKAHENNLSALMITYPSTHGVFEESIKDVCAIVHKHGGQVYMDGANMNAQVGLCRPFDMGADVCHLNLHKTFCIPHGGGGPGVGPICVAAHLAAFLPGKPTIDSSDSMHAGHTGSAGPVAAAPWGSASILLIAWAYIQMMGARGLTSATCHAILNANYVAHRLAPHFHVVYRGNKGLVAHECIVDMRSFKKTAGIEVDDIAKRLMDYGFHAPTMSFPIAGTMMIEPTESESLAELDRFCDAMIAIREEIRAIEQGRMPREDNPLKHAPHTIEACVTSEWTHPYSREVAAFPAPWTRTRKFWPTVGRVNGTLGDRNLVCTRT